MKTEITKCGEIKREEEVLKEGCVATSQHAADFQNNFWMEQNMESMW